MCSVLEFHGCFSLTLLLREASLLFSLVSVGYFPARTFMQLCAELSQEVIGIETKKWRQNWGGGWLVGVLFVLIPAQFTNSLCFLVP